MGGYTAPQATTRIEFTSVSETDTASKTIQQALRARGFHLQPTSPFPEELSDDWPLVQRWRDRHRVSLVRHQSGGEDLMAYVTPYPSAETFWDVPGQSHFPILEVRLVEYRPGGFSPEGHRIHAELMGFLGQQGYHFVVISKPPATDEAERKRVIYGGLATTAWWWLVAWLFGSVTVGAFVNWLLTRMHARQTFRRATFVIVGIVLVTPLPYPAGVGIVLLPSLIWFLFDITSYANFMVEWLASGVVSGALSAVAAIFLIRDGKKTASAEGQLVQ